MMAVFHSDPAGLRATPLLALFATITILTGSATLFGDTYGNNDYGFRIDPGESDLSSSPLSGDDAFSIVINSKDGWQVRIRVAPVDSATTSLDLQKKALGRIANDSLYSIKGRFDSMFAGHPSHGVAVDYEYNGEPHRIVARFLVSNDLRYIVQSNARASEFDGYKAAIDRVLDSFELVPIDPEKRREHRLDGLAARCGSELSWEPQWASAAARARDEGKLVFVTARFYPGFDISDTLSSGALFDQDVVRLIQERYVPLRLDKGDDVPFRSYDTYGLGPSTFGQAILLVTPDGDVVHETFTADAASVDELLRRALPKESASEDAGGSPMERAQHHFDRGDLASAAQLLVNASTVDELRLRASIHRRNRDGVRALADLRRTRDFAGESYPPDVAVDEAEILARTGDNGKALALLRKFVADNSAHPRVAEAKYWIASIEIADGEDDLGTATLREIVDNHFADRWAWKAAATLTSTALSLGVKSRLSWPEEDLLAELRTPRREMPTDRSIALRDAVAFLVDHQRPDGTWVYPSVIGAAEESPPNPVANAVSALVAASLVPHRAMAGVEPTLERALKAITRARQRARAQGELLHYMDYWVWAKTYQLLFVSSCLEAAFGPRHTLLATARELVDEIAERQRKSGGWSYYLKRDLSSSTNDAQSISFVTAPVALTLLEARDAGVEVPEAVVNQALDCLAAMRNANGSFDYMGGIGIDNGSTGQGGAAGRGPLCELALYRGGRSNLDGIRNALRIFMEQREGLAREQGKNLMHAGPEGQGSHYLLFDYACTAAAVSALPADEHGRYREMLLELVYSARYEGGGYMDNPGMGRACGTALALMALREVRPSAD